MNPPATNPTYIAEKLEEIASSQAKMNEKIDEFFKQYIQEREAQKGSIDRAHVRVDRLEADFVKMQKDVDEMTKLTPFIKAQSFIITGLSIPFIMAAIAFIWQVITHKVVIP